MASSFVSYKEKGVWVNDEIISIASNYIVKVMDLDSIPENVKDLRVFLDLVRRDMLPGASSINFNRYATDDDTKVYLIKVLTNAQSDLEKEGPVLSQETLNDLWKENVSGSGWHHSLETRIPLKLISYMILILEERVEYTVKDNTQGIFYQ